MTQPLVVVDWQGQRIRIIACNKVAAACGIHVGMAASAAQALADGLIIRPRDPEAERASLQGMAMWAGRFTPSVTLAPPNGLLLEIGGCLRLHRGLADLLQQVRVGVAELGYTAAMACAPTAHGAWLLAKAGLEKTVSDLAQLEQLLVGLPLALLEQPPAVIEALDHIGVSRLGDCLRLPRSGIVRRFGQALVDEIDRALGRQPEARARFVPPPSFERSIELPTPAHAAEALQFAMRRLLLELEGFLMQRQAGVAALEWVCHHERRDATVLKLGLAKPMRDAARIQLLMRETLGRTRLQAPVHTLALRAPQVLPLAAANTDLFQKTREADGEWLLERLRIRLGRDAVHGIETTDDHRPEHAWRPAQGTQRAAKANRHRPLWLLPRPLPRCVDAITLASGPERIESGWWDGGDIARDYYVAQDCNGTRLWVYCDRASGKWYVHGVFA
ncbi:MAG: DNA polymerase Y family protein [Tepidimonas sp.]|uniref:Y-family DNA polymerase n=1 Tax=Tepidimonas sp. TaxID=2002775 RepID=UPI00259DFFE7|nr:DNA polymerase Y family protein [Tepidimonas sp.]MDM7456683.1 DNA polymerase Y family protein [Tepidimonas sp.]